MKNLEVIDAYYPWYRGTVVYKKYISHSIDPPIRVDNKKGPLSNNKDKVVQSKHLKLSCYDSTEQCESDIKKKKKSQIFTLA